jgi:hypothetical protein
MYDMVIKKTLFEIVEKEVGYSWPCGPDADSDPDPINEFYVKLGVKRIDGDETYVTKLDVGRHESHILHHEYDTEWNGWDCYGVNAGDRVRLTYEDWCREKPKESWREAVLHDRDILEAEVERR